MTRQDVAQLNAAQFFLQKCFFYILQLSQMWILGNGQSLGTNIYVIFETQEIKMEHCLWHLLTTHLAKMATLVCWLVKHFGSV